MSAWTSILVHLDSSPGCQARLSLAYRLAERHECEVRALFAATPAALSYPFGAGPGIQLAPITMDFDRDRRERARAIFDQAVASGMPLLRWDELGRDEPLGNFARHALYHDLLVLGQREPKAAGLADVPPDFSESVLIDSGKPALIVPYIGAPRALATTPLIAWKETREAARAVAAAMPLLRAAGQVHVALWSEAEAQVGEAVTPIELCLQRHGVAATVHRCGQATREVGEHLLSLASDVGADLLVMGCYGHARSREWVLGGASRTILQSMTVPVLMAH